VEDVLQNAIVHAYRDFQLYVENTNFRAWIFRYLNLKILEQNRESQKLRTERQLPQELPTSQSLEPAIGEEWFEALGDSADLVLEHCDAVLAEAVSELEPQAQSVLLLRAIGEFKYAEIADILEIPLGTVMSSLARSRQRLRKQLAEYGRQHGLLGDDG